MAEYTPDRRQVVKAGAIAWTVPTVLYATAVPAFASSGANMSTSSGSFTRGTGNGGRHYVDSRLTLVNSGTGPTSTLTVTITLGSGTEGSQVAPAGWTITATSGSSVTFTATNQLAAGASETVTFRVYKAGANSATSVSALVDPGGGGISHVISGVS